MPRLHVLMRKEELRQERLADKVVVVLDILFATSSIVTALAQGARAVVPACDAAAAQTAAERYSAPLLSGEHMAQTLPGFADPTPQALAALGLAGRTLIYATTNGTVALDAARGAAAVYAGALLNAAALCAHLRAAHAQDDLLIVCAGSVGCFNLEDFAGAGALVARLCAQGDVYQASDAAIAARLLYGSQPTAQLLAAGRVGQMMDARGLAGETAYAAREDVFDVVPRLQEGELRPLKHGHSPKSERAY